MALSAKELQSFNTRLTTVKSNTNQSSKNTLLRQQVSQVLSQGPQMIKPIVTTPTITPTKVSTSPIDTAKKALGDISTGISNTFKTIGNNIKVSLTAPKIVSKLPENVFQTKPVTQISHPIKIKPGQTKIDLKQLQQLDTTGTSGSSAQMTPQAKQAKNIIETKLPQTTAEIKSLTIDPLSLKSDPKKAINDGWEAIKQPVLEGMKRSYLSTLPSKSITEELTKKVMTFTGATNVLFSPISALFAVANDIPVLSSLTKIISLPFMAAGEAAPQISNKIIDELPLPDKFKAQIKPAAAEVFTLAAQLATAKVLNISTKKAMGTINKIGVDAFEKLTKDMVTESGSPRTVNFYSSGY